MNILKVDKEHLDELFLLNKSLAEEERQLDFFTLNISQLDEALNGENSVLGAYLCQIDQQSIGFYAYVYKYATYLGKRVLYIEDLYIKSEYRESHIEEVINHIKRKAIQENCCRVDMRVLKTYNMGVGVFEKSRFNKVEKWDVFRFEVSK